LSFYTIHKNIYFRETTLWAHRMNFLTIQAALKTHFKNIAYAPECQNASPWFWQVFSIFVCVS
jgi:hypothetical protein